MKISVIMAMLRVSYDLHVEEPAQRKSISKVNVYNFQQ